MIRTREVDAPGAAACSRDTNARRGVVGSRLTMPRWRKRKGTSWWAFPGVHFHVSETENPEVLGTDRKTEKKRERARVVPENDAVIPAARGSSPRSSSSSSARSSRRKARVVAVALVCNSGDLCVMLLECCAERPVARLRQPPDVQGSGSRDCIVLRFARHFC